MPLDGPGRARLTRRRRRRASRAGPPGDLGAIRVAPPRPPRTWHAEPDACCLARTHAVRSADVRAPHRRHHECRRLSRDLDLRAVTFESGGHGTSHTVNQAYSQLIDKLLQAEHPKDWYFWLDATQPGNRTTLDHVATALLTIVDSAIVLRTIF